MSWSLCEGTDSGRVESEEGALLVSSNRRDGAFWRRCGNFDALHHVATTGTPGSSSDGPRELTASL